MFAIERIEADLQKVVAGLDPACIEGPDAARLTKSAARIERLAATAKMLLAQRAAQTNAWRRKSHAATSEQWLAETSGCSEGAARELFATANRLTELPATEGEMRSGDLSPQQASQVTAGAIKDPSAEDRLLRKAKRAGMRELRDEKERVIAGVTDEDEARANAKRDRNLRTWTKGFATHGQFSGPTDEVAKLLHALEPLERAHFEEARRSGKHEPRQAYRFDALIDLADVGTGTEHATEAKPPAEAVRVRVDFDALLRGHTQSGETCEIPGVGPVPVAHARDVLSHGLLQLVITDGVDVQTVVSNTRHVPAALKIAIAERDLRCKVRGCDRTIGLHRHHTKPFSETHHTRYSELGNACDQHHHLIHDLDYSIVEHVDGTWSLRAPANAPPGAAAA